MSRISSTKIKLNTKYPIFLIKFMVFSLENLSFNLNLQELKKYVILGSLDLIAIYCLSPLKEVLVIPKPEFIIENVIPDAQVGMGLGPEKTMYNTKKEEKNQIFLVVSWGKVVYFYKLQLDQQDTLTNIQEIGYYINNPRPRFGLFALPNNVILVFSLVAAEP